MEWFLKRPNVGNIYYIWRFKMERVLVLDQSYLPINIVRWQKAIQYIATEKVEIIREYDQIIRSAKCVWKLPAVVRFITKFHRPRRVVKFSKQNVFIRDRYKCQYCGKKFNALELTYDHVMPKSRGGKTEWENIVASCIPCNTKKGNKTPKEARMKLRKIPTRPDWIPIFAVKMASEHMPQHWKDFCYGF